MSGWQRAEHHGADRLTVADAHGVSLSFAQVLTAWRDDRVFRADTVAIFAASGASAYFWEMPPLSDRTAPLPFECRLVPGDALLRAEADPGSFSAQFAASGSVVSFSNLGGDATLLVPRPRSPVAAYGHVAAFFRTAPAVQSDDLLRALGALAMEMTGERPVWISTAGLGVPWLHVRFDARPKYYRTSAYRDPAWRPAPYRR